MTDRLIRQQHRWLDCPRKKEDHLPLALLPPVEAVRVPVRHVLVQ